MRTLTAMIVASGYTLSLAGFLFCEPAAAMESRTQEPSIAERLQMLDTDHDGMVSVSEVRRYIESQHGTQYAQSVLNEMESSLQGKSCSTPFANRLYR